jgi:chaperonin GroES
MKMKKTEAMQPFENQVVVRPCEEETRTPGGIYIPDNAKQKSQRGTVVALGPGRMTDAGERLPMTCAVGDTVLFPKWSGTEMEFGEHKLMIFKETDLLMQLV